MSCAIGASDAIIAYCTIAIMKACGRFAVLFSVIVFFLGQVSEGSLSKYSWQLMDAGIFQNNYSYFEEQPTDATCGSTSNNVINFSGQMINCTVGSCMFGQYPKKYDSFTIIKNAKEFDPDQCEPGNITETLVLDSHNPFDPDGKVQTSSSYGSPRVKASANVRYLANPCRAEVTISSSDPLPLLTYSFFSYRYGTFLWSTIFQDQAFRVDMNDKQEIIVSTNMYVSKQEHSFTLRDAPRQYDGWIHVTLQIINEVLSVFINGELMLPTVSVMASSVTNRQVTFGGDNFNGKFRDTTIFLDALSSREIEALYLGHLPYLPKQSRCLCGSSWPVESPTDASHNACVSNRAFEDGDYSNGTKLRFAAVPSNMQLVATEYAFDHDPTTYWISTPGLRSASISAHFPHMLVLGVELNLGSTPAFYVRLSLHRGSRWVAMQYLSVNCAAIKGLSQASTYLVDKPEHARCQQIVRGGANQTIDFFGQRKPGFTAINPYMAYIIGASGLRLDFVGLQKDLPPEQKFHAANALKIYYKTDTSSSSPCYEQGLSFSRRMEDGTWWCSCKETLNRTLTGPFCEPYISSMSPAYGPAAGGTRISIHGALLGSGSFVFFDSLQFHVVKSNDTCIECVSAPAYSSDMRGIIYWPQRITVVLKTSIMLRTTDTFTYRPDPVITSVEPRHTIFSGGVNFTVTGTNLESVYKPYMTLTKHDWRCKNDPCDVINSTVMVCPSPSLTRWRRKRRDSIEALYKDVYIGFRLDGLKRYENLSQALPGQGTVDVFDDPSVEPFPEDVIGFKVYESNPIVIKGQRLTDGVSAADYFIEIGEGMCDIQNLSTNQIICMPPKVERNPSSIVFKSYPRVKVKIGRVLKYDVGYLHYPIDPIVPVGVPIVTVGVPTVTVDVITISITSIIAIMVIVVLVCYIRKKRIKRQMENIDSSIRMTNCTGESITYLAPERIFAESVKEKLLDQLSPDLRSVVDEYLIANDRLKLDKEIGRGHFGKVYKGQYIECKDTNVFTTVAVKCLTGQNVDVKQMTEFLEEATVMCNLRHINVLGLIGIAIDDNDRPLIVLPLMDNGDLRSFIANPDLSLTIHDLMTFGLHVATGMAYLASQKFIHRDLAARNCMVSKERIVKIADFGLARDMYEADYYRIKDSTRPLPIKWMAVEALKDLKFTTKSDVWSFGVVLWEIFTRGDKPYAGVANMDMKRFLLMGRRLEKPQFALQPMYNLMMQCWEYEPDKRPTFDECVSTIESFTSMQLTKPDIDSKLPPHHLEGVGEDGCSASPTVEQTRLLGKEDDDSDAADYLNVPLDKDPSNTDTNSASGTLAPPMLVATYKPGVMASVDEDATVADSYTTMSSASV